MAKTSIIIPLFCVYIIYTDMHRVNVSPSSIPPPTVIRLLKEICGSLSLRGTCRYRLMSLPLMYFQKAYTKLKIIHPVM